MTKKRITIADVASAAGVSLMTVSRAINGRDGINEETRQRILKIAAGLGYRPSQIARGLVTHQSATLGLVMPDVANPFFAQIARGAEEIAYQHNYSLFLINTGEDSKREIDALNSLLEKEIDGAVLCSSRLSQQEMMTFLELLPAAVLVNRELKLPNNRVATLNVDDCSGTQSSLDYLVSKDRKNIALLAGPQFSVSGQRRVEGYHSGLHKHHLPIKPEYNISCAPTTQGGNEAALLMFHNNPEVDAVIAFNDLVAVGVMRACQQTARRVPEDVAVIGADDIPLAALTSPSLTTLHVDMTAIGENAMQALLHLIDSPEENAQKIVVQPKLLIRQSA
jgi:LacI family transcriptional regulator